MFRSYDIDFEDESYSQYRDYSDSFLQRYDEGDYELSDIPGEE